ncbi:MAG: hypothetical protein ACXWUL_07770, partial [Caldimonas sp.]
MSSKPWALAAALAFVAPAHAVSINMSDFTFGVPADVVMAGTAGSPSYTGSAGQFTGEMTDDAAAAASGRLEF